MSTDHVAVPASTLREIAEQLSGRLAGRVIAIDARAERLDALIREAETWQMRRAANNDRDRACYRVGAALEPNDGHLLDDIALSGLDHLGAYGLLLMIPVAVRFPKASLSELLRRLFASSEGDEVRAWGVWARGCWLREMYVAETEIFIRSKKGRDPKASWRREKVTSRQQHLFREIARCLEIVVPEIKTRGEAFEWIKVHGGNPRFAESPAQPALPAISRIEA